ncbi:uncharacterized protein LOC122924080 [Bufo gargarizans]|uniref:uncharacterized protein LOC122924080 n=1 Tax=Bufo gargarizans TaxID=30331 RepID=UPI001CF2FFC9|nr:uncharacterized protein LOC122924080 [Bufo gargarizans]
MKYSECGACCDRPLPLCRANHHGAPETETVSRLLRSRHRLPVLAADTHGAHPYPAAPAHSLSVCRTRSINDLYLCRTVQGNYTEKASRRLRSRHRLAVLAADTHGAHPYPAAPAHSLSVCRTRSINDLYLCRTVQGNYTEKASRRLRSRHRLAVLAADTHGAHPYPAAPAHSLSVCRTRSINDLYLCRTVQGNYTEKVSRLLRSRHRLAVLAADTHGAHPYPAAPAHSLSVCRTRSINDLYLCRTAPPIPSQAGGADRRHARSTPLPCCSSTFAVCVQNTEY